MKIFLCCIIDSFHYLILTFIVDLGQSRLVEFSKISKKTPTCGNKMWKIKLFSNMLAVLLKCKLYTIHSIQLEFTFNGF